MFKFGVSACVTILMHLMSWLPNPAVAAQSAPIVRRHDQATLITDRDQVGPDQTLHAALRLQLQPGWHTYWKNPGDAGEATTLKVTALAPRGASAMDIQWPTPSRIKESGLMAYGYEGDVILPVTLRLPGHGPVTLRAHAEWLVCGHTCVPEQGDFELTLPGAAGEAPAGLDAPLFEAASRATPRPADFNAQIDASGRLTLRKDGFSKDVIRTAWFMPSESGVVDQLRAQDVTVSDGVIALRLKSVADRPFNASLAGVVVLEDVQGRRTAYEITARRVETPPDAVTSPHLTHGLRAWLQPLLYAFLGGIILNLMPCVFPVLAMKALAFLKSAGVGRRTQLKSALGYALGVIGTFLALAFVMIGLREAGAHVGWGFQFQSGFFVLGVMWLLLLLGLNLSGVFEIMPAAIDGRVVQRGGLIGDFMTGVLAVIVATPCTAPFMGSALAVALSANLAVGAMIFIAMGLGLAMPYTLIACFPALGRYLPKPGSWMLVLKQFLAFPLFGSCVWLLWVVTVQGGPLMTLIAAAGAVAMGLVAWLYGLSQKQRMRGALKARWISLSLAILVFMSTIGLTVQSIGALRLTRSEAAQPSPGAGSQPAEDLHAPWSPDQLAHLRAAGTPVLVDITAAWCITCLVNERVALSSASVRAAFAQHHVQTLVGDWTRRDDRITTYLAQFKRDGVPLYVYYAPGQEGVVLPQILTPNLVIRAIEYPRGVK